MRGPETIIQTNDRFWEKGSKATYKDGEGSGYSAFRMVYAGGRLFNIPGEPETFLNREKKHLPIHLGLLSQGANDFRLDHRMGADRWRTKAWGKQI